MIKNSCILLKNSHFVNVTSNRNDESYLRDRINLQSLIIRLEIKRISFVIFCSRDIQRTFVSTFSNIIKIIHFKLKNSSLFFLHLMKIFKHLSRTEWLRIIKNFKNVITHMYRLSLLIMFALIRLIFLSIVCSLMYNKMIWISTDIYF